MSGEQFHNQTPAPKLRTASYPIALYESLLGRYFTAETPILPVGGDTAAWGALYNPCNSGVNLHVNVVTLNYVEGEPLTISFFMNADLPGEPRESHSIAPANTALCPLPEPEIRLLYASCVHGHPQGGQFTFSRTAYPNQLLMLEKDGVFIVPPGGSYCAFVRGLKRGQEDSRIYLAYGWWEEPICEPYDE